MRRVLFLLLLGTCVAPAQADLYAAEAALANRDFERAFALYRELAELGHLNAQENLAVMYVNGEGVARDNVQGYAWATIALEQRGGVGSRGIVDQLEPHMNDVARQRASEVRARYGRDGLLARLLPVLREAEDTMPVKPEPLRFDHSTPSCAFARPANPDEFFPRIAIEKQLEGNVILDFTVLPDGRAHNARVLYSTIPMVFDEAARATIMHSLFKPKFENGASVSCHIRVKLKFKLKGFRKNRDDPIEEKFAATKARAVAGDPEAQFVYGVLLLDRQDLNRGGERPMPWLLRAAQAGVAGAQYFVGVHALNGVLVEPDPAKGVAWLSMAAAAGHAQSQVALANYFVATRTDNTVSAEARKLLELAAAAGDLEAKYRLAGLLATAADLSQRDPARAVELISDLRMHLDHDPAMHEALAAALAAQGDFKSAIKCQTLALSRAMRLGWATSPQKKRLTDYVAQKTFTGTLFAW
ncbi:MAG: TonB family protein [Steroidobacteraceae bacterium]|nr:TonB family protein [Steroidobacteraceae bacterium]